ncbi:hypothetical protein QNN95_07530 [Exiguobacterium acetylicum]|uniref:hypothetical protein n=1 Tax=Exiguobacterium acetylicum TaxID=41170 RepID=UPI0035A5DD0B
MKLKRLMIEARKLDGRPHYSWDGYFLKQTKDYLLVANIPGRTLHHHHRRATVYTYDNYSLEFYPFDGYLDAFIPTVMNMNDGKDTQ